VSGLCMLAERKEGVKRSCFSIMTGPRSYTFQNETTLNAFHSYIREKLLSEN
jgi:hypothetical protein